MNYCINIRESCTRVINSIWICDLLDNLDTMQVLTRRIVQETELFIILIEIQS